MLPQIASEVIDATEATFNKDETTGKMTGVVTIIKAGRAKNPRNYRSSAIRKAAKEGIYDGMRMFVNHSDKPPTKRSLNEMVAAVESTSYDPKTDSVVGNVEYFSPDFFDYAQRAKRFMGVSASHRIKVNKVRESATGQLIDDVEEIVGAHSVDWVIYPSAGGEVISFARESEGADEVEWTDITLEDLKAKSPEILAAYKAELVKESTDSDNGDNTDKSADDKPVTMTMADITKLVQEQVASIQTAADEKSLKQAGTAEKVRAFVSKSGLPARTQSRVVNQFLNSLEYVETSVKEAVDEAKAELKEAGAGPRITGMGTSGSSSGGDSAPIHSVRESVESVFGFVKETEKSSSGKES